MASQPSLVLLLVAVDPALRGLLDVLRDWSALGLIQPLLWVDEGEADRGAPLAQIVATLLSDGTITRLRLQDHLADRHHLDVLRIVPVSTVGAAGRTVSRDTATHLYTGLGGVFTGRIVPVHCLLPRHGRGGWRCEPAWSGWHTLVLAPEDAWTPATSATDLTYEHSDGEWNAHAAAGVASLAGLWTGVRQAVLDAEPASAVSQPVVARSFLRRLDASAVTVALRQSLGDCSGGLPLPHYGQSICRHLSRPDAAVDGMARAVFERQRGLLAVWREGAGPSPPERISALAALRMFWSACAASLRRTPRAVYSDLRGRMSESVSRGLQRALFGTGESRFEVIASGRVEPGPLTGPPASPDELARDAQELARRVHAALDQEEPVVPNTGPFWRDVLDGALTLADGEERVPDLAPQRVGGLPGIVPDVGYLAPDPRDSFEIPAALTLTVGVSRVPPHDVLAQAQIADRLRALAGGSLELTQLAERFKAWQATGARAFTTRIGQRLATELRERAAAVTELSADLCALSQEDDQAGAARETRLTAMRLLVAVLLGAGAIATVCAVSVRFSLLSPMYTVALVAALGLGLAGGLLVALIRQQQRIFAILAARSALASRQETAARTIGPAARELHVATVLYQQYLAWAAILGRFQREPFGPVPPAARLPGLAGPLPRALGLGVAHPQADAIVATAHELGPVVFSCGWMGRLWQEFLRTTPWRLGPAGLVLQHDPSQLLSDEAATPASPLRLLAGVVTREGITGVAGAELWSRARSWLLSGESGALSRPLFADVEVVGQDGHGVNGRLDGGTFFGQLLDSFAGRRSCHFSAALFHPAAVSQEEHRVASVVLLGRPPISRDGGGGSTAGAMAGGVQRDGSAPDGRLAIRWVPLDEGEETGLDQFVVVVQRSNPLPMEHLRLLAPAAEPAAGAGTGTGTPDADVGVPGPGPEGSGPVDVDPTFPTLGS